MNDASPGIEPKKVAGYFISDRGHPIAAGVQCRCPEIFCPAHGRDDKAYFAVILNTSPKPVV
jgi:hypothetical protein